MKAQSRAHSTRLGFYDELIANPDDHPADAEAAFATHIGHEGVDLGEVIYRAPCRSIDDYQMKELVNTLRIFKPKTLRIFKPKTKKSTIADKILGAAEQERFKRTMLTVRKLIGSARRKQRAYRQHFATCIP